MTIESGSIVYSATRVIDVPADVFERERLFDGTGEDACSRAYKLLRTRVLHRMKLQGWRTMAVLSPNAGEGKTLTAINLGMAIANSSEHTSLLVDCDWRRPSVHKYFDLEPTHDVTSYLSGDFPMSEAIVNPGITGFCIVPCKVPVKQSSEQLASAPVGQFVAELRERYHDRIIIFDMPPMLLTDDALSFLPHVDCVLVVVEEDRTDRESLERVLELVGTDRLLATVLNKSNTRLPEY